MKLRGITAGISLMLLLAGCGGGASEPKSAASEETAEPAATQSETAAGDEEAAADEEAFGDEEGADDSDETGAPSEEASKPDRVRSPKDIIGSPGVMFTFSFKKSDAYEEAQEKCEAKAGDDLQKKAQCMSKAHEAFPGDSVVFSKDDKGKWWWVTIRRRGSSLNTLHKIEFEFGEETDDQVTLKTKGRDMGAKPMRVPSELVVKVPSDAEIVLEDPKHGKMVYEARMGLIGEAER